MKKGVKIMLTIFVVLAVSCLIGLGVTGYMIGWGPFARLRYLNKVTYDIADSKCEYKRERKTIEGPNGTIVGYLFTPEKDIADGRIIILSHGLATEQWHNLNTADSLASAGLRVFMFDYCGGSIHAESDGKTTDMSILTEKEDLNTVIDTVKTWNGVDPNKIGIIGYSQGGLVASLVAVERDDIERLCLLYPAFSAYDQMRKAYTSDSAIPETSDRNGMQVGRVYYSDVMSMDVEDIYEYAAKYERPVMIQQGTEDKMIPYESSVKADELYPNSELITIEGAGHGFSGEDDIKSVQEEYRFFTE